MNLNPLEFKKLVEERSETSPKYCKIGKTVQESTFYPGSQLVTDKVIIVDLHRIAQDLKRFRPGQLKEYAVKLINARPDIWSDREVIARKPQYISDQEWLNDLSLSHHERLALAASYLKREIDHSWCKEYIELTKRRPPGI